MRAALLAATLLAGCGADGPPVAPEPRAAPAAGPRIDVSGTAEFGVVRRRGG